MVVFWIESSDLQPQLITPENEGGDEDDDDQSPQREKQRQRSRSRERVHSHVQVPQKPQIQPMVTPESDDVSNEDSAVVNPSSPSAGPPPSAEQGNLSRRAEGSRARERVHTRSSSRASQQQEPVVPRPGIQQNQATQSEDEDSTTVDPQNRVSNHSRSPQDQEDLRRQGLQTLTGIKKLQNKPSTPPEAKKHKPMDSDEDDEEPQHEP